MPELEGFDQYFEREIFPSLHGLDEHQKKVQTQLLIAGIAIGLCELPLVFGVAHELWGRILFITLGAMVFFVCYKLSVGDYHEEFSKKVMEKMVRFFDQRLNYERKGHISKEEYATSELYSTDYDHFSGSDLVWGRFKKTQIRFSFLHVTREEEEEYEDEDGYTHTVTVFRGLMFIADFHKSFEGKIFILPHRFHLLKSSRRVLLENPEFHKMFDVYASDQITARYVLSTSLIERIMRLKRLFDKHILKISLINSRLYIGISNLSPFKISILTTFMTEGFTRTISCA